MSPLLKRHRVRVVAISRDSVRQAAMMHKRDGLSFTLLADPKLEVIKQYGLLHRKGFAFFTFFVGGIALGFPTGFQKMAIPTSILVDEQGRIRWIDQAGDYRLRGDAARIENALRTLP